MDRMRLASKLVWTAGPALLALAAALDAQAITQIVGTRLAPSAAALAAAPVLKGAPPPAPPERVTSADPILTRNPFDHLTNLGAPIPSEVVWASPGDPRAAPPCETVHVVAIAASSDPDWSFAALASGAEPRALLRRRGDEIDGQRIAFVGWDRVWMAQGAGYCQTALFQPKEAAPRPPPTAATPKVAGASSVPPDIARGIRKLSATEFEIDRATLDRVLETQHELMSQTRVMPDSIDGRIAGIRLLGIKPDGLLGMIGLVNSDRIDQINGLELTSPERALEAYARIRNDGKFNLRILRDGKPMTIDYTVK